MINCSIHLFARNAKCWFDWHHLLKTVVLLTVGLKGKVNFTLMHFNVNLLSLCFYNILFFFNVSFIFYLLVAAAKTALQTRTVQ